MGRAPIIVLGIHQRSGTAYLGRLLATHPDCTQAPGEDFLVAKSRFLDQYFDAVYGALPARIERSQARAELLRGIGRGLTEYLEESVPAGQRVVAKTPSVEGLERVFDLFPEAIVLILVRDGRAVAESHARTFGSNREGIARQWRDAARAIMAFDDAHRDEGLRYRIVRYEDLYGAPDPRPQIEELLRFADLDPARYPFAELDELPVIGSSETAEEGEPHWQPVARDAAFNPLGRADDWTAQEHRRFNRLAGAELEAFRYQPVDPGSESARERIAEVGRDARWLARAAGIGGLRRVGVYHRARALVDRARGRQRVGATLMEQTGRRHG